MKQKWKWDILCSECGIVKRGKRHSLSISCAQGGESRWIKRGGRTWMKAKEKK